MLTRAFHAWERRLVAVTRDRVVRPFDWGLEWIPANGHPPGTAAGSVLRDWVETVLADTDRFFHAGPAPHYQFDRGADAHGATGTLSFESALTTPHAENNVVSARYFAATGGRAPGRAVLVLPQWNADPGGHTALCRLLACFGISALRLSLPYHDRRMPPELHRADYIVSSNVGRTIQVCRQAVLDARRAVAWLRDQGHDRIGILGTSLGSCLAMLTTAHESLIRTQVLNHISPFFADVVWRGLSTAHVRAGLEGHIDLDELRALWMPISPQGYLDRIRDRRTLLIYARYDLTFPVDLSRRLVADFTSRGVPYELAVLPCGHYSTGAAPFKYLDGYRMISFLARKL